MQVWLSEFTYKRLVDGLKKEGHTNPIPILHSDEYNRVRVDLDIEIYRNATKNFGPDIDKAINEVINQNQRVGTWPKKH